MSEMGVVYEAADLNFVQGFLQRRQGSLGIIVTGIEALVCSRDDESRLLDSLENLTSAGEHVQIVLLSHSKLRETRACMVHYELLPFPLALCKNWMQTQLGRAAPEEEEMEQLIIEISHPLCLGLMSSLVRMGDINLKELSEAMENKALSLLADKVSSDTFSALKAKERRF